MKTLTPAEQALLHEFLEELEALVDADDGTCFTCKHIDLLDNAKEILGYGGKKEEEQYDLPW